MRRLPPLPDRPDAVCVEDAASVFDEVALVGRMGVPSRRDEGVRQARAALEPHGYRVHAVPVTGSLHLKTACCALDARRLLVNPAWLDAAALSDFETLAVPDDEPWAANLLALGDTLILQEGQPCTQALLEGRGFRVGTLDLSELQKAEAGIT